MSTRNFFRKTHPKLYPNLFREGNGMGLSRKMLTHKEEIFAIALRAEGLQLPPLPKSRRSSNDVRAYWKRWLRFGGLGDWRILKRRMRSEGFRPSSLFQPKELNPLPAWCSTLDAIMSAAKYAEPGGVTNVPLADLLAPVLGVAQQKLAILCVQRKVELHGLLHPDAQKDLSNALLSRLAELAAPCVCTLLDEKQGRANNNLGALLGVLLMRSDTAPRENYQTLVASLLATGYYELFQRWPVLARLVSVLVENWVDATAEFIERLANDWTGLQTYFFEEEQTGLVAQLFATLSDPHAGGRCVIHVIFESGAQLIYKPRPVDMEYAFAQLLEWLNCHLPAISAEENFVQHYLPKVLPRDDYGWMEWIAPAAMEEGMQARYHWRLGSVIALYRAFNGVDLHIENAIAHGEFPVLVDVECLLHPSFQPFLETSDEITSLHAAAAKSLIALAALPNYGFANDGSSYSHGLFNNGKPQSGPDAPTIRHPNTDWMAIVNTSKPVPVQQLPHTVSGPVNSLQYRGMVADGYRATLTLLLKNRPTLLDDAAGPLSALRCARGRHLARHTMHYGLLLREASMPQALESGVQFDLSFEALYPYLFGLSQGWRAMAPVERDDLRELDAPRFMFRANSKQVFDARGAPLGEGHIATPFDTMLAQLKSITQAQVDWEAQVLEHCLHQEPSNTGSAQELAQEALSAPNGDTLWFSLCSTDNGVTVRPLDPALYNGSIGIAIALAAIGITDSNADYLRLARTTFSQTIAQWDTLLTDSISKDSINGNTALTQIGLGFDRGLAGMLFALQAGASLFADPGFAKSASAFVDRITSLSQLDQMIESDKRLDLLNGLAGLLLAMLSWYEAEKNPLVLRVAQRCGERLLITAMHNTGPHGRYLYWPVSNKMGLSGLSHGSSGFALALTALYRATKDSRYREAALAALRHEATLFDLTRKNWRDLRGFTGEDVAKVRHFGASWCHGAPGIGLARATILHLIGDELDDLQKRQLEQDLLAALKMISDQIEGDAQPLDDLCCGSAGCIDILLECGRLTQRLDLIAQAQNALKQRQQNWRPKYWFTNLGLGGIDLGLFKGIAGWPYLRARIAMPERVPCMLVPMLIQEAL